MDSPSTSISKTVASDTQSIINQTIFQQLTTIGERLNKIEQKTVKKTLGPHKSKRRSAVTKNTKVVPQSDSTHTSINSAGTHATVTNTHTAPNTVSLPTLDHLRTNDNIQKVVAVCHKKSNLNVVDRSKVLSNLGLSGRTNTFWLAIIKNVSHITSLLWGSGWQAFAGP